MLLAAALSSPLGVPTPNGQPGMCRRGLRTFERTFPAEKRTLNVQWADRALCLPPAREKEVLAGAASVRPERPHAKGDARSPFAS